MNEPVLMLIRHAEKPAAGERAVDRRGEPDEHSLGVGGWLRAGALVSLFAPAAGRVSPLPRPRHLLAAAATSQRPSTRPRDTLLPLAEALALDIDLGWSTDDPLPALAAHLVRLDGPVLVCWRHDGLPALAAELMLPAPVPERWPEARHDLVWLITRSGAHGHLTQVPQLLLGGDSAHAIPRRVKARAES